ncbi:helix-turn-helix domain-containing protein [Lentilactobacillus sp. Marseille-Q4993]|uniref:helix-turn-helix domain-containing protein n=1 Tax=Lentilactobacillus sp. Marseille-Q4993 TaxID=3039492 RepID=UPI0024BCCE66|nr:helix-turn-helix domain-containing protein [Lentilactobacillus sp. Marseille-Q4993]
MPYFGAFHEISVPDPKEAVSTLTAAGLITSDQDMLVTLTEKGREYRNKLRNRFEPLNWIETASKFDVVTFKKRFILALQVISEFSYDNNRYYPSSIDFFNNNIVKKWFINYKDNDVVTRVHKELESLLDNFSNQKYADIFAQSFVGHEVSGHTNDQIGIETNESAERIAVIQFMVMASMVTMIIDKPNSVFKPLLSGLIKPQISGSTEVTYRQFVNNSTLSLERIADLRHIKVNTVKEHLIEAAMVVPQPSDIFSRLISDKNDDILNQVIQQHPEWTRFINLSKFAPDVPFMQARLFQIKRIRANEA